MKIIGHRGARSEAPENTIAAIKIGLSAGVDAIEIDVHVTSDDVPVLMHDTKLIRGDQTPLIVAETTYAELKKAKPDVATLAEVITFLNRRVPLMVEVKPQVPAEPIIAVLQSFLAKGWSADRFWLASRDYRVLKALHTELPSLKVIVIDYYSAIRAGHRARHLNSCCIALGQRYLYSPLVWLISRRYELYSWPINTLEQARRWQRFGLAGAITDNPSLFRDNALNAADSSTSAEKD